MFIFLGNYPSQCWKNLPWFSLIAIWPGWPHARTMKRGRIRVDIGHNQVTWITCGIVQTALTSWSFFWKGSDLPGSIGSSSASPWFCIKEWGLVTDCLSCALVHDSIDLRHTMQTWPGLGLKFHAKSKKAMLCAHCHQLDTAKETKECPTSCPGNWELLKWSNTKIKDTTKSTDYGLRRVRELNIVIMVPIIRVNRRIKGWLIWEGYKPIFWGYRFHSWLADLTTEFGVLRSMEIFFNPYNIKPLLLTISQ
jgi:hypothetical protein